MERIKIDYNSLLLYNKDMETIIISMEKHPIYSKLFKRLKNDEFKMIENFIEENNSKNKGDFEYKINRLFLDKEKPKNWAIILELLSIYNTKRSG